MYDLVKLNRRIALHWLGTLATNQVEYLGHASICLGLLVPRPEDIIKALETPNLPIHNGPAVARLNRQYLRYARLASKDVAAGKLEMLLRLGIDLEQADMLSNLTNDAITRLAFGWRGAIVSFNRGAFMLGASLNMHAARHHGAALIATCLISQ